MKTRVGRFTLGQRTQVLIAKALTYTTQADYKSFVANAAAGELGVFEDSAAMLLVPGNALVTSTKSIFVALKRATSEGNIDKTQSFKPADFTIRYTGYSAPVKQVTTVVLGEGSTGSAVIQDITYTSVNGGTTANNINITYVVAGNSTALSVAVAGNAITVNLATSGGGAAISTATQVQAAIAASAPASALVTSAVTGTGATVQVAQATTNLQGGVQSALMVKGTRFAMTLLDLDVRSQPFPTYEYEIQAKAGESFDSAVQRLVDQLNNPVSRVNQNRDQLVTAVYTAATNTLVVTAIDFGTVFRLVFPASQSNTITTALSDNSTQTVTTAPHQGSGTYPELQAYELAGQIGDGITTQYPIAGTTPSDYSTIQSFIDPNDTYDIFNFSGYNTEASKTPHQKQHLTANFAVISPLSGSNPTSALRTIFGF